MSDDVRPGVVGMLLAGISGDLDANAYDAVVSQATPAEVVAASVVLGRAARAHLDAPQAISILDLPVRALQALAAAYGVLARRTPSLDVDRRVGDVIKVIPSSEAEIVINWLLWAGLLPEDTDDSARPDS